MNGKQDIIVSLSNLNSKEKQLLLLLIMSPKTEFSPIEISRVIGVTNRTVINRLSRLESFGFVEPELCRGIDHRIYRAYGLFFQQTHER